MLSASCRANGNFWAVCYVLESMIRMLSYRFRLLALATAALGRADCGLLRRRLASQRCSHSHAGRNVDPNPRGLPAYPNANALADG